ncbi:MAG: type II toxin-antitoxin system VapC family toxin [Casimicrobiaceae bacterium]|nr:type II toxin-antitoxin system VapC family toxin [Casimicrobiaceae bacterium]MCX8097787.1 type II toxin-antitoxin system VapC family toxin [Casimicrobiaceae bacterium]MDW8312455.1 type II toxin-antitoxin system VapC family toxin [Burkholderiales bacterium]
MRLLLDTCAFLWLIWSPEKLPAAAHRAVVEEADDVFLSSITIWEAMQKHRLGRLEVYAPEGAWPHFVAQREAHGLIGLPFDESAARHLPALPNVHRDPFDRMLICQAIEHSLTIVTPDRAIQRYPIRTLWE